MIILQKEARTIFCKKFCLACNNLLYNQIMEHLILDLKNKFDFFIRNILKCSRKNYTEMNEYKDGIFASNLVSDRANFLCEKYKLESLKNNSTIQNYLENLYVVDLLDKYLNIDFQKEINALDIGCKNWFYAKGEHSFFKNHCERLSLAGIEVDPSRLYSNLYSRYEVAKFHIKGLENTNFIGGDFLKHQDKYDYITWILPFVFEYPHLKWGLPKFHFNPKKMLEHAVDLLEPGGMILIVNQGIEEFCEQKRLCDELNINYTDCGEVKSDFYEGEFRRYLLLLKNDL